MPENRSENLLRKYRDLKFLRVYNNDKNYCILHQGKTINVVKLLIFSLIFFKTPCKGKKIGRKQKYLSYDQKTIFLSQIFILLLILRVLNIFSNGFHNRIPQKYEEKSPCVLTNSFSSYFKHSKRVNCAHF